MKNKTFKSITKDDRRFNLLTLPNTNFFKFEIRNEYGSNIERVVNKKTGKNIYGISHLIEHLGFKSTKEFTTKEIWSIGKNEGVFNASTSYPEINYWFETTADKTDLAIKFVCNIALNDLKRITQKEFDTEKKVVYNEAKRLYDNHQQVFYRNAVGRLVGYDKEDNTIGIPETIDTFSLEDAIAVKNIFLTNNQYSYNITYDNTLISEDAILDKVITALNDFAVPEKASLIIDHEEYLASLKKPRIGEYKIESESKQAISNIFMDTIDNTIVSGAALWYLSSLAEDTSLDDVIRQQNGLTYGVQLYMHAISYKPYACFACDVSVGNEEKLLSLFKESINLSADALDEKKYEKFISTVKLKRVIQNLNLNAYSIWFHYDMLRASDLDEVRDILAVDIEAASEYVENNIITYDRLKKDIERIRNVVNNNEFGRVYS